ncbi:DoxX family protein [Candidatus Omnitrophota bacterium]
MLKGWALLPLRFGLGIMFVAHGLQKAFGLFGGPGMEGFTNMIAGLGLPFPTFMAYLAAYIELLGGLFLIIGLFLKLSAASLLAVIFVAMMKVHLPNGFFLMNGGIEYNIVIIAGCLTLIFAERGKLCVTNKL